MRLETFQVTNFRSIEDSGLVAVGAQTCLVGKNEAGKMAILHALAGLNPHPSTPIGFDKERDYPRRHLTEYASRHGEDEAVVVRTVWSLDEDDLNAVAEVLGPGALQAAAGPEDASRRTLVEAHRHYGDEAPRWNFKVNFPAAIDTSCPRMG